ncbi:MAG: S-layer family protein [Calothrix sp. SM1_7_51]|nr:S-layer family protein [Calothrix sp. SM1_7_51]
MTIKTRELLLRDGSRVFVRSLGTGSAGNLTVRASSIRLDNQSGIVADTRSNRNNPDKPQATITLNIKDLLLLRDRSRITANARGENVVGGSITIDSPNGFVVAIPNEISFISTNSNNDRGGKVSINARSVLGFQLPPAGTEKSYISARGARPDLSGIIQINTPEVDPARE